MTRIYALLVSAACLAAAPAHGQTEDAPRIMTQRVIAEFTLDELFEQLPHNAGAPVGRRLEAEILRRFNKSGSATADLLLSWAAQAMEDKDYPLALDLLDQIVILKPDFAEAWNRRATVYYMLDDYGASISDIRQTLALEPRHFGALSGYGRILQAMDRDALAIRVYKRALEINPQLESVEKALERLEKDVAGESI